MSDIDVQMEGVTPTYDKRRKGYKFKKDGMEIFIKGEDQDAAMKQMSELLESKKEDNIETHSFAEGGMEDGGLKDEGGTVDPVSGNEVPVGSTQKEVRDDIPAQLSEGEFVFPADVTRYIGLENLMELRNKAKAGLAKMDAMGQMGNSEEATMNDSIQYDDEIDQLIDNFDPNSPESMEFFQGGVVYAQQGAYIPQQQFSYGYGAPTGYTQPQTSLPLQTPFVTSPARVAVGQAPVAPELRRYVGPNNEILMIPFYDGKPMKGYTIPAGYKFKPEEEAVTEAPEIVQPTIAPDGGNGADDREREAEREAQMARDKEINNTLASYDDEFAKLTTEDPFMTGKPTANITGAIYSGVQTHLGRTAAIERIAEKYNMDLDEYKNEGLAGLVSKYNDERFARDLQAEREDIEDGETDFPPSPSRVPGRVSYDVDEDEPVSTPRGKDITAEVREALAQQRDDSPTDDKDTGSASKAGGEDTEAVGSFSKGGAVQQTKRALKSSRKK